MPETKIILTAWDSYQSRVISDNADETQRTETRRAFYAGAAAAFYGLNNNLEASDTDEPTEEELAVFDGIHEELQQWRVMMERGLV